MVFPTVEKFMGYNPEQMYYFLTSHIAQAIASGYSLHMVDDILSCFDEDARRELVLGVACARALGVDPGYRDALKHAMATVLYQTMKEKGGAHDAQG